ncbi:MAG TPA: YbdK family carboxylate-amine ligase [Solirubrobacteraceae bacterium]|nr:YbdK family carboxylate-amine ligase [Solirubrobacteraceae bacterium]
MSGRPATRPDWAAWNASTPFTLGVEEEIMMLDPSDWTLAQRIDAVLPVLPAELSAQVAAETHGAAIELTTGVHTAVAGAVGELRRLRRDLAGAIEELGLRAAAAGTHPTAVWQETEVSSGRRYKFIYGSMRELARREPTFALHVHVGVPTPQQGIDLYNRLRGHLPLFLALSVNSPFWQGRDTGLASARTPLFQAFPRVGMPRHFASYQDYTEAVDLLVRCDAFPEHTFLWWDVRPQPGYGTVEVRIMDSQTTVEETSALVALVQAVAKLELEEGWISNQLIRLPEVLIENRFLAARDGMEGRFIDPDLERRVPVREQLERLVEAAMPHAEELGCAGALRGVEDLAERTGAQRQLEIARGPDRLPGLVRDLAGEFTAEGARLRT